MWQALGSGSGAGAGGRWDTGAAYLLPGTLADPVGGIRLRQTHSDRSHNRQSVQMKV